MSYSMKSKISQRVNLKGVLKMKYWISHNYPVCNIYWSWSIKQEATYNWGTNGGKYFLGARPLDKMLDFTKEKSKAWSGAVKFQKFSESCKTKWSYFKPRGRKEICCLDNHAYSSWHLQEMIQLGEKLLQHLFITLLKNRISICSSSPSSSHSFPLLYFLCILLLHIQLFLIVSLSLLYPFRIDCTKQRYYPINELHTHYIDTNWNEYTAQVL